MAFCLHPSLFPSVLPDGFLSGEGFVLLLDLELWSLQAQSFPALRLLDAAIAAAALAFLQFGWQPATTAFYWVAAGKGGGDKEI